MSDYRKDEIIYDEQWRTVDTPLECQSFEKNEELLQHGQDNHKTKRDRPKRSFPTLTTIQLLLCFAVAFAIFMLKAMNSDVYHQFSKWYNDMMQYTLVSDSTFEDIDLSQYLPASFDEIN